MMEMKDLHVFARKIRIATLEIIYKAKASHIGGAFSMVDLLAVLYGGVLRIYPENESNQNRDIFLLSKGHACTALYATLMLRGFFPKEELTTYAQDGSRFTSHTSHFVPGVELSTGSLGHALSVGCGRAMALLNKKSTRKVYVLISDGELDEGSNWEAILFAGHKSLGNLVLIVDYNKIQSFGRTNDVLNIEPVSKKFQAFGWEVIEIDGHDHEMILNSLRQGESDKPKAIIAHTVKGKGVSFMENKLLWHYKSPSKEQYEQAKQELSSLAL